MQSPLHILHLEDDGKDAELLLAMLEAAGIDSQVTLVDSQEDFLASLEQGGCDLILADYSLPSFDGLSALKIALEKCPDVPFIFVSGTLGEEVAVEALKIGATDYVLKERLSRIAPSVQRAISEARERVERKRAEEALGESRARLSSVIASAMDAIITTDADQRIVLFNSSAEQMFGYPAADAVGQTLDRFIPERFRASHRGHVATFGRTEVTKRRMGALKTVYGLRANGEEFPVEASISQFEAGGQKLYTVILRDITERKRQEEELRQAQAAQFEIRLETRVMERTRIARELHDTLLQSFQALLLRFQAVLKMLPDRPVEARQRLESSLDQAAEAITDARVAIQGLRSLATKTSDLARAITAVGEELTAHRKDFDLPAIHVEVEGAPRNLKPVVRDEAYRIACEALRNACRHAQARRITVAIRYEEGHFRLTVRDDGKGIDKDLMERQPSGHFGLPGMRERAETVGGHLEVWSKLDSGTEIELSIPGTIAYDGASHQSVTSGERPT